MALKEEISLEAHGTPVNRLVRHGTFQTVRQSGSLNSPQLASLVEKYCSSNASQHVHPP